MFLLALSVRNCYLLLVIGNHVSPWFYVVVLIVWLIAVALVCYGMGWVFGFWVLYWFWVYIGMLRVLFDKME